MSINIKELQDLLKHEIVKVTFTKLNGEQRIMECTQNMYYVPVDKLPHEAKEIGEATQKDEPPKEETSIRVFDIIKGEWRSFRKDSVISYGA